MAGTLQSVSVMGKNIVRGLFSRVIMKSNILVLTLDPVFKDKMILGTIEEF